MGRLRNLLAGRWKPAGVLQAAGVEPFPSSPDRGLNPAQVTLALTCSWQFLPTIIYILALLQWDMYGVISLTKKV